MIKKVKKPVEKKVLEPEKEIVMEKVVKISPLLANFATEDLNKLVVKINEIITYINEH